MFARIELPAALTSAVLAVAAPALLPYCVAVQIVIHLAALLGRPQRTEEQKTSDGLLALLCIVALVNCLVSPFPDRSIPQALRLLSGIGLVRAALGLPHDSKTLPAYGIGLGALSLASAAASHLGSVFPILTALAAPLFFVPASVGMLAAPRSLPLSPRIRVLHLVAALVGILGFVREFWSAPWDAQPGPAQIAAVTPAVIFAVIIGATAAALLRVARLQPAVRQALPLALLLLGAAQPLVLAIPHQWAVMWSDAPLEQRIELWSRAAHVVESFPFTGAGMGAFGPIVEALYPPTLSITTSDARHTLLQIASDIGIPGALIVSLLWLNSLRLLALRLRTAPPTQTAHWMAAYAITIQMPVLIAGLSQVVLWGAAPLAPLAWFTIALAVRLSAPAMGPQKLKASLQGDAR